MVGRKLHGYGLPLGLIRDYRPGQTYPPDGRQEFTTALHYCLTHQLTVRERSMIAFMNDITDKPHWTEKIKNETIIKLWLIERAQKEKVTVPEKALSERMFAFCLQELQDYADLQEEHGYVPAIAARAVVYKSDTLISDDLSHRLRVAAAALENIPETERDWHPGSDERVLDLVHPSLFPLLYGRTRILPSGTVPLEQCLKPADRGEIIPVPQDPMIDEPRFYSERFQWLPCQVDFTRDEDWLSVRISSYINNLHPDHHKPLYEAIEGVIAEAIPMWDATLSSLDDRDYAPRIYVGDKNWIEPEGHRTPTHNESAYEAADLDEEWRKKNRILIMPEPGNYHKRSLEGTVDDPVDLREDFADQGLQVIVKLANIHLTPDKPRYEGGSWHIEGQMNEHICASAIYYYDSDNVMESYLSFREAVPGDDLDDKMYEQDDYEHLERLYGIENRSSTTQVLGHVRTKQGRLIAFPNVLQHRVSSFELEDQSRAGHRKILALFLVDPHTPIPSTAHVPPQRRDWWRAEVKKNKNKRKRKGTAAPPVFDLEEDTIDMDEAKALRLELMKERKAYVKEMDERYNQDEFSFCEH